MGAPGSGDDRLSTVGSWILDTGLFLILGYAIHSLLYGWKARVNLSPAVTLEWMRTISPRNFARAHFITGRPYAFEEVDNLYGTDLNGERKSEAPAAETASHLH